MADDIRDSPDYYDRVMKLHRHVSKLRADREAKAQGSETVELRKHDKRLGE